MRVRMSENMALLSQAEIDALVEFLTEKKNVGGEVLDQVSIDRLVHVLRDRRFVKKMDLKAEDAGRSVLPGVNQALLLDEESDLMLQQENCRLLFEINPDETVSVICRNTLTGKCHTMTPACLTLGISEEENENTWGKAIAPIVFDSIAGLLRVEYTRSTFAAVCERYAEVMFGNKERVLPSIYMPNGKLIMQHMRAEEAE